MRLKAHEERLAALRKQAECYTIRAPHDGMIVYPPIFDWLGRPLRAGLEVFQHEELFHLPDLSRIEVEASIHKSEGAVVRVGMPAEVRIIAQPGRVSPGKVVSLEMLRVNYKGWEMRLNYFARVRLDETGPGCCRSCPRKCGSTPDGWRTPSSSRSERWRWLTARGVATSSGRPGPSGRCSRSAIPRPNSSR